MQEEIKMAIYVLGMTNPHLAKEATEFLTEEKLDTVEKLREAVYCGTLTEQKEANSMPVIKMIDVLLSTEQYAKFH